MSFSETSPLRQWRVYTLLDDAHVLLPILAHDRDEARRIVEYHHDRGLFMVYLPTPGVEVRVYWNKILDTEIRRVELQA